MKGFVQRFDFHAKLADEATQQTLLGGVVTILSFVVVVYLLLSEILIYNSSEVVMRMLADTTIGMESIRIEFDVEFPEVRCEKISFMQEVTRGAVHIHEPEFVKKEEIHDEHGASGCWLHGYTVTDKAAGNFRFAVEPAPPKDLSHDPSLANFPPGFQFGGALHFEIFQFPELPPMRHKVNSIGFKPIDMNTESLIDTKKVADVTFPLVDTNTEVDKSVAVHHYALQVVPTHYKPLGGGGLLKHANQYSYVEKQISVEQAAAQMGHITIAGQQLHKFYGVVFSYDFYPLMVVLEERREGFVSFVTSMCGIIGGVITVLGLLEKCLHTSQKAILGKKD